MKNFKAVIYDLVVTLIDSSLTVSFVLNKLRLRLGLSELLQSDLYDWISLGGKDLIIRALNITEDQSDNYLAEFRKIYVQKDVPISNVYPNVIKTLSALTRQGIKIGLCSNKPRDLVDRALNDTGLISLFDCALAGDDLPTKKPSAANLNWCLNSLSIQPDDALFVGDSTVDQMAASNTGIPFAFFSSGYNDGVSEKDAYCVFHDHGQFMQMIFV